MKPWKEVELITENGEMKSAVAPLIISASRSTDIPAFHSEWMVNRIAKGYICRINPYNRSNLQYISFQNMRLIVFWTKNPEPMIEHLTSLDQSGLNYYFQFTLNNYEKEGFEPNLPSLKRRLKTFIRLSELMGREKVIWRFDPLLLADHLTIRELLNRISEIGNQLVNHTNKLVFSFADILRYRNVQHNLIRGIPIYNPSNVHQSEFTFDQKIVFAEGIQKLLNYWNKVNPDFQIATCAEDIDLEKYEIVHNKCIDDELIAKLFPNDHRLMDFLCIIPKDQLPFGDESHLKRPNLKDKGQRKACGCIMSKDIGTYNTCNHLCVYCYANSSSSAVKKNLTELDSSSESLLPY